MCAMLYRLFIADKTDELLDGAMGLRDVSANNSLASDFTNLWAILKHCAYSKYSGDIICVVDALDELASEDRERFLKELDKFFSQPNVVNGSVKLKFLITSRPYAYFKEENLKRLFGNLLANTSSIEFPDISSDINLVITARVNQLGDKFSTEARDRITARLREKNDRTFLWLYLTFKYIEEHPESFEKSSDFDTQLDKLPEDVSDAYSKLLDRVTKTPAEKKRAETLLQIVFAAPRPLDVLEANYAITLAMSNVRFDSHESLTNDLYGEHKIQNAIRVWSGFMVDVHDGRLLFIHQTVREFLDPQESKPDSSPEKEPSIWQGLVKRRNPHDVLTKILTDYYLLPDFDPKIEEWRIRHLKPKDGLLFQSEYENASLLERFPLLGLADLCWANSFEAQDPIAASNSMSQAVEICDIARPHLRESGWPPVNSLSPSESTATKRFFVACMINALRIVKHILESSYELNCNVLDRANCTPLKQAIFKGHTGVVEHLMADERVDYEVIESSDDSRISSLHLAIRENHVAVVDILGKDDRVDFNLASTLLSLGPPLTYACSETNLKMVQAVLNAPGINMNIEWKGASPLTSACTNLTGDAANIVGYLLHTIGLDVNHETTAGWTALITAARWTNPDVVRLLFNTDGIDTGFANRRGETALIAVARSKISFTGEVDSMIELICELDGIDLDATLKSGKSIRKWLDKIHYWEDNEENLAAFKAFNREIRSMKEHRFVDKM